MKRIIWQLVFCFGIVLFCSSCTNSNNTFYEKSDVVMDTVVTLSARGSGAKDAVEESFVKLAELDSMASPSLSESDVCKVNNAAGKSYVKVHPEIFRMIETSLKYSQLSDGSWDITIGPITNLWGIGTDHARVPTPEEIADKLALVGYTKVKLNEAEQSVFLQQDGMQIDLGAIAKGFAVDEVRKIYIKHHIENGLINLGASSIYAIGRNKDNQDWWRIGMKHPCSEKIDEYMGIIKLEDESLSTSGNYERYFIENNKRYNHIFDPKTGYPVDNGVISDTVIINGNVADNGMLADLLSTTAFILGPEKGIEFLRTLPETNGEITTADYKIHTTTGFRDRIGKLNSAFQFAD